MMPRNLIEIAIVLVAGLAFVLGASSWYLPALATVMLAFVALVLVRFLHWRRTARLSLAEAPSVGVE